MHNDLVRIAKSSSIVFVGRIVGLFLGLVLNLFAARYLGAEAYGRFMLVYTIVSFISIFMKLGLDQGIIAFIPKEKDQKKSNSIIIFAFGASLLISTIMTLLLLGFSKIIAVELLNDAEIFSILIYMSPFIILLSLIDLFRGVYRSKSDITNFVLMQNYFIPSFKILIFICLYFLGYTINGLIVAFYISTLLAIGYFINSILKNIKIRYIFTKENVSNFKEVLKFSAPLILIGGMNFVITKSDVLMIGYYLNSQDVGVYSIAVKIGTLSSFILVAFNTMFAPVITRLYSNKEIKEIKGLYTTITKWSLLGNLIIFSIIISFSQEIMILFGDEFLIGSTALILVAIGQLVNSAVGPASYINTMTGKPLFELYISIVTACLNILLNVTLIPIYGIEGAAIASLLAIALSNLIKLILVYGRLKIHPYNVEYIKVILAFVISTCLVIALKNSFHEVAILQLIMLLSIYFVSFILIYGINGISSEDKMILSSLLKKIKRK
ncbi:oligosaccharide flippase family protein [Halobacillus sp. SY10]|uniref:oligosaccharide flippase family protein n=1 Tax=Halobacillus sp. SY10 TaxID=3381356 RepID=UPI003879DFF9